MAGYIWIESALNGDQDKLDGSFTEYLSSVYDTRKAGRAQNPSAINLGDNVAWGNFTEYGESMSMTGIMSASSISAQVRPLTVF